MVKSLLLVIRSTFGLGPITWSNKKKHVISLSSIEARYQGTVNVDREVFGIRQLLTEFGFSQDQPTTLWCDGQGAIHIACNPIEHRCTKYIEVHMHYMRQLLHQILDLNFVVQKKRL
jgi:hypothetical protein